MGKAVSKLDFILIPISFQNCLNLSIKETENCRNQKTLVVHEDVHDVVIDLLGHPSFRSPRNQHELNAEQRHQNKSRSHSFHVEIGFRLVSDFQLGDENTYDI